MSEQIFQRVRAINELAGNKLAVDITDLLKQGNIIKNELYEFLQGIADGNLHEMRDGQGDIIFTGLGLPGRSGFPYAADLHAICDNQFSKFDLSPESAELTRAKYAAFGVETDWHQGEFEGVTYYVTTSAKEQLFKGQKIGKGKWLKSHKYLELEYPAIEVSRTPWVGTELSDAKLQELRAELAIQGYVAKYGAVAILKIIDDFGLSEESPADLPQSNAEAIPSLHEEPSYAYGATDNEAGQAFDIGANYNASI